MAHMHHQSCEKLPAFAPYDNRELCDVLAIFPRTTSSDQSRRPRNLRSHAHSLPSECQPHDRTSDEAARKINPECRPSGAYWRCKEFLEAHRGLLALLRNFLRFLRRHGPTRLPSPNSPRVSSCIALSA